MRMHKYMQDPMHGDAGIWAGPYAWGCMHMGRSLCMELHSYRQDPMHGDVGIQDVRCEGTYEIRYGETGDWMMRQQLVEKYGVK